jgi:hypothetical protein
MATDLETAADLDEVLRAKREGRPVDQNIRRRIEARAAVVIEEIRKRGMTDIAVEVIRSSRDE